MESAVGLPGVGENPLVNSVGCTDGEAGDEERPESEGERGDFEEGLARGPAGGALFGEGEDHANRREGRAAGGADSVGRMGEDAAACAAAGIVIRIVAGAGAECADEGHDEENESEDGSDGDEDEVEGDGHCRIYCRCSWGRGLGEKRIRKLTTIE